MSRPSDMESVRPTSPGASEAVPIAQVARWVLRVGVFLMPLAFLPNVVDEFVLPKLLLSRLLVVLFALLLIARWLQQRAITWRRTTLDLPILAFLGSAALSTVFAVNRNIAIFGTYDRWEGLLTLTTYGLLFWLAVQMMDGERDARGVTWSLLISGYVIAAIAVLQSGFGLFGGGYFREGNVIRADVTLANPDFLGIFLAMLLPIAVAKLVSRRPATTRILAANLALVLLLGLLVTFTRAAWIGAVVGVAVVFVFRRGRFHVIPLIISIGVVVIAFVAIAGLATASTSQSGMGHAIIARLASIGNLGTGTAAKRIEVWGDTLHLVASRPILGYGPDTFGLVYPGFQSGNRLSNLFDKPHQEALGIAAYQGLIGLAAYVWILVAFMRAFWRGRQLRGAVAIFGGIVAYIVSIQADFSWIPISAPFWLLSAAAIVTWSPNAEPIRLGWIPRRVAVPGAAAGAAVLVALLVPAIAFPYVADVNYFAAPASADLQQARAALSQARALAPYEAVYAASAGEYALNLDQNGNPAANADWSAAREAYDTAARLGSFSPEMFRELALVDEHLGDHAAALAAAKRALELDRYDAASRKLLAQLTGQ